MVTMLKPRLAVASTSRLTREVSSSSWRGDKTSTQRGYGYRWQQARERYLREHPLCVMCYARRCITAATVVDHIVPHQGDQALFWRESNWQGLCAHCHSSAKQRAEARDRRLG